MLLSGSEADTTSTGGSAVITHQTIFQLAERQLPLAAISGLGDELAAVADALHEQERVIRLATAHDGRAFGVVALTDSRVLWAAVSFAPAPWCWPGRVAACASRQQMMGTRASRRGTSGGASTGSSPPKRSTSWRINSLTAAAWARRSALRPSDLSARASRRPPPRLRSPVGRRKPQMTLSEQYPAWTIPAKLRSWQRPQTGGARSASRPRRGLHIGAGHRRSLQRSLGQ